MRALIVEDQAITALDEQQSLVRLGYDETEIAMTGEEAILLARELRPDLILMDIKLAGAMRGTEAAAAILAERSVPIVFVSAFSNDDEIDRHAALRNCGRLGKPFMIDELKAEIARLCDGDGETDS